MIIVIGSAVAAPECAREVRERSLEHVQRSREEAGCIAHNVSVDCENPARFVFVEYWENMGALIAHFALEDSQAFVRDLRKLLAEDPVIEIFNAEQIEPGAS
ncbi:MAG: antibiotic biosynthesis monooxygenase [Sphingomonadaceae bacterium]|nr:antibiotic biosynthesis monooxygenase [Sphingomonadaceae bacterium]